MIQDRSCSLKVIAVIPNNAVLDDEAQAASAAGLPVLRFTFLDSLKIISCDEKTLVSEKDEEVASSGSGSPNPQQKENEIVLGIHRGFMLSGERFLQLYSQFFTQFNIRLHVSPPGYEATHYYPNTYNLISNFSPRSCWCPLLRTEGVPGSTDSSNVPDSGSEKTVGNYVTRDSLPSVLKTLTADTFTQTTEEVIAKEWRENHGITHVMLKDYVKSAKPHFVKVPIQPEFPGSPSLAQQAVNFVHERGTAFNRGVVFKEYVPLPELPSDRAEWRLWFIGGKLHSVNFNSENDLHRGTPRVPNEMLEAATISAQRMMTSRNIENSSSSTTLAGNPFVTIDFAIARDGHWFCLEAGDGGVSGPAVIQDLTALWTALKEFFSSGSSIPVSDPTE